MTSLKEVIESIHKEAEETKWSQLLISGNITHKQWIYYLNNMSVIFNEIEKRGLIDKPMLLRSEIFNDELNCEHRILTQQTELYVDYLNKISDNQLLAHIYTHYLAFLYGGQYIVNKIKHPTKIFYFDNPNECIQYVRELTNNIDHEEVIKAFEWTIRVYNNLWHNYN